MPKIKAKKEDDTIHESVADTKTSTARTDTHNSALCERATSFTMSSEQPTQSYRSFNQ